MVDNNIPQITKITIPDLIKWGFFGGSDLNIEEARKRPVSDLDID
jgi:hypothetical protein